LDATFPKPLATKAMLGNHFDVPGASLYYETVGAGPLLLMIPGANGDTTVFTPISQYLSHRFTVVLYDRRGYSRSELRGDQDYERKLEVDADDACLLIQHLANEPAFVFGSSSGAIVAIQLLLRHPSVVHTLIPHEPPAVRLLGEPDASKWVSFFADVYDTYRKEGIRQSMDKFAAGVLSEEEASRMKERRAGNSDAENAVRNLTYWFEHELRQYPSARFDVAALDPLRKHLVLICGRESSQQMPYLPNTALATKLGLEVVDFPGAHLGYLSHPEQFAQGLVDNLHI